MHRQRGHVYEGQTTALVSISQWEALNEIAQSCKAGCFINSARFGRKPHRAGVRRLYPPGAAPMWRAQNFRVRGLCVETAAVQVANVLRVEFIANAIKMLIETPTSHIPAG